MSIYSAAVLSGMRKHAFMPTSLGTQAVKRTAAGKTMKYLGAVRSAPKDYVAGMINRSGSKYPLTTGGAAKAVGALGEARSARSAAGMGKIGGLSLKSIARTATRKSTLVGAGLGAAGGAAAGATSKENKGRNAALGAVGGALGGGFAGHVSAVGGAKLERSLHRAGRQTDHVIARARSVMANVGRMAPEEARANSLLRGKVIDATDFKVASAASIALLAHKVHKHHKRKKHEKAAPEDDEVEEKKADFAGAPVTSFGRGAIAPKRKPTRGCFGPAKAAEEQSADDLWDQIESGGKIACDLLETAPVIVKTAAMKLPRPPMSPSDAMRGAARSAVRSALEATQKPDISALNTIAREAAEEEKNIQSVVDRAVEHVHPPVLRKGFSGWLTDAGESLASAGKTLFTGKGEISSGQKLQLGGAALLLAGGGVLAAQAIRRRALERQYDDVLKYVMDDPELQNEADYSNRVPEAYKFLQRYAPTLAQDSVMARAFCRQIIKGSGSDMLSFRLANELSQAEQSYKQTGSVAHEYADINKILSHPATKVLTGQGVGGGGGKGKR